MNLNSNSNFHQIKCLYIERYGFPRTILYKISWNSSTILCHLVSKVISLATCSLCLQIWDFLSPNYTLRKKVVAPPFATKSICIEFSCSQWAEIDINVPVTVLPRNPTLSWPDFHFNDKWDGRSPKPKLEWSFPQICLAYFSQFSLIVLIVPCIAPLGISHEVVALAWEGMWQSAIASHVGLTCATINGILGTDVATRTLVPGKSTGAPWKTTPCQDRALLRMVGQDSLISVRALMAWMRNLYGMRAGQKIINNPLLTHGCHAYRHTKKPLLTANHHRLHLEWAQRW